MTGSPDVLIIGTGVPALRMASAVKGACRSDAEVVAYDFDKETDRWRLETRSGELHFPRVVVAARGSLTIHDACRDGMEPYLGVVVAGFPNLFLLEGSKSVGYIAKCLALMQAQDATRIELRGGTQREFNRRIHRKRHGVTWPGSRRRAMRRPDSNAFELSNLDEREHDTEFSGSAVLSAGDRSESVQVHLNGHFEPLDGVYHWYGRVVGDVVGFKKPNGSPLVLTIGDGPETPAALAEEDPWGNYRITGVGAPPFTVQPTR